MATDKVSAEWGELLFDDADMQERLSRPTYKKLRRAIEYGEPLDLEKTLSFYRSYSIIL